MIVWFGYDRIITINKRLVFWEKIDLVCKEIIPTNKFLHKNVLFPKHSLLFQILIRIVCLTKHRK